jgi:hypothetical protein
MSSRNPGTPAGAGHLLAVNAVQLAADEEYLDTLIAEIPAQLPGGSGWSGPSGVLAWCCSTGQRG